MPLTPSEGIRRKVYLGDGIYCGFDGRMFVLWTEVDSIPRNILFLELEVLNALFDYAKSELPPLQPKEGTPE